MTHGAGDPVKPLTVAVLTISDSRTLQEDDSGDLICELLEASGHRMTDRRLVADEPDAIRGWIRDRLLQAHIDALVLTGGTGISSRDRTVETVRELFDRPIAGFGELFRMLSFDEIGARALLSRAQAGVVDRRPIFCLPGSTAAVRLAMERLILPILRHVVGELRR